FDLYLIRDPQLFVYTRDVPADLPDLEVPPMILLPIAENAMKHGPSAGHRGELVLRVRASRGALDVDLSNPGGYTGPREGGSGLPIIEKRLALVYGDRATFQIRGEGERTIVSVHLPAKENQP